VTVSPTDRLLAIEAIKQLKARYFRFVDTKDWASITTLFAEDAQFTRSGAFNVRDPWSGAYTPALPAQPDVCTGREEIVKMMRAAVEPFRTVHHGYTPEINILNERRASGIWAMFDEIRDREYRLVLRGWGHYHETYELGAEGWVIKTALIARMQLQYGATADAPERYV
jgi:hypothetical protein